MHKVIDIEERIPSLKERRKKRKNMRFFLLLIILAIALCTLLYFQLPISHVKNIEVVGNEIETKEYYVERSGLVNGDSIWGFKPEKVVEKLENEVTVKQATVTREWLNDVKIALVENKKIAIIKTQNQYNYVLEDGQLLMVDEPIESFDLPILTNMPHESERKELAAQLMKLDNELLQLISQIDYTPTKNKHAVKLYMNDGHEVRANMPNLASRLQYYPSIVSQLEEEKKGVINLEIGGYYNSYKLEYK